MFTDHHELYLRSQVNADKKEGIRFYTTVAGEISNPTEAALNEIESLRHVAAAARTASERGFDAASCIVLSEALRKSER